MNRAGMRHADLRTVSPRDLDPLVLIWEVLPRFEGAHLYKAVAVDLLENGPEVGLLLFCFARCELRAAVARSVKEVPARRVLSVVQTPALVSSEMAHPLGGSRHELTAFCLLPSAVPGWGPIYQIWRTEGHASMFRIAEQASRAP